MNDLNTEGDQPVKKRGPDKEALREQRRLIVDEFQRDVIVALDRIFDQEAESPQNAEFHFTGPEGRFHFRVAAMDLDRAGNKKLDERLFVRLDSYDGELSSTTRIAIKNSGYKCVGDLVKQSYQELLSGQLTGKALAQISGIIIEPLGFEGLTSKSREPVDVGADYYEEKRLRSKSIEVTNALDIKATLNEVARSKINRGTVIKLLKESSGKTFAVTEAGNNAAAIFDMSPSRG